MFYKYRGNIGLDNPNFVRDIEMIKNNEIWCSNIKDLNDPTEASFSLEEFEQKLSIGLRFFSFLSIKRYNPENVTSYKVALNKLMSVHTRNSGIYSLSKTYNNELMWAHYSNSHKGYCIEYDFNDLKDFGLNFSEYNPISHMNRWGRVNYSDKLFQLKVMNPKYDDIIKFLLSKSKKWEYEEEYRVITSISGKYTYNPKCLKSITFGMNINELERNFIIKNLEDKEINFYQLYRVKDQFQFYRKLIKV